MALLPDLCDFNDRLAEDKAGADGQGRKVDATSGDVFGKVAILYLYPAAAHRSDVFIGKERDLPVPVARMGIPFDSVIDNKIQGRDR